MSKLISLIGTSGSGKTTVHEKIAFQLEIEGYRVEKIIEPHPLRDLAKSYRLRIDKNPWTEAAIFTTDRLITYHDRILPRMKEEKLIFLSARNFFDTIIYQGILGGVDLETIKKMNSAIPYPDLTLALVVDGEIGYERLRIREKETGEVLSKNETPEMINQLRDYYHRLPHLFSGVPIHILNTSQLNEEETFRTCYDHIGKIL
ncbi:MAG: hypothetical protein AABX16_01805 [Nanoarchaeota archaeon]